MDVSWGVCNGWVLFEWFNWFDDECYFLFDDFWVLVKVCLECSMLWIVEMVKIYVEVSCDNFEWL